MTVGAAPRRPGYELVMDEQFDGAELDPSRWIPHHLPHWSSRADSAARYALGDGRLRLRVEADQGPWAPGSDGETRVSSLQTAVFAGPLGSSVGQHRFAPTLVVREEQENRALLTPHRGYVELRARATDDPHAMVALWMIGLEDRPECSAEICVCEIFGSEVRADRALVGMGLHPFGDPSIVDDFEKVPVAIDARDVHTYAVDWTPEGVSFLVDGAVVKTSAQSPDYPMQLMLGIYEFPEPGAPRSPGNYPKEFVVDHVRTYRRTAG